MATVAVNGAVHDGLGFGAVIAGAVARMPVRAVADRADLVGHAADARGAKWAVVASGGGPSLSPVACIRLAARACQSRCSSPGARVLGGAESFIITGATAWGLARVGAPNAGKVIAWMGTAMFGGFAAGAPLGTTLYAWGGFATVACVMAVVPRRYSAVFLVSALLVLFAAPVSLPLLSRPTQPAHAS